MNINTNRLNTFYHHNPPWPYVTNMNYHSPEEFANAGFYNVSTRRTTDRVQCYLCDVILDGWKQGQSPLARHALASATCPLVILNFPDALTTIPMHDNDSNTYPESAYMTNARLKTFTKHKAWPPVDSNQKQMQQTRISSRQRSYPPASKMAEAGFIFLPTETDPSRVKCPYCHSCLDNLTAASNPWTLHQRMKPDCIHVTRRLSQSKKQSSSQKQISTPRNKNNKRSLASTTTTTASSTKENQTPAMETDNVNTEGNDDGDDEGLKSRFDDSIWDIAKAHLNHNQPDLSVKRQRTSNTKLVVTYSRKERKKPTRVLPPELTKSKEITRVTSSTTSTMASKGTLRHGTTSTYTTPSSTALSTTTSLTSGIPSVSQQSEETPAQVLARLQKRPNISINSKDKGKGRATESLPSVSIGTSSTMTKLGRNSLRLSTTKRSSSEKRASSSSTPTKLSTSMSSPSVSSASSKTAITTSIGTTNFMTSEPKNSSSSFLPNFASSPLPHSTPIHSRIDHGNDLMALTLSPIRPTETTTSTTVKGVFGNLDTPVTTKGRTETSTSYDISQAIEHRFRAKRRAKSNGQDWKENNGMIPAPTAPLLDFDSDDDDDDEEELFLTNDELAMTVEEYIQALVERKVALVVQQGEQMIKDIEKEVANTKLSILANDPLNNGE
ncbi:uncharacterized protein BX664DRAFT_386039 [Halteromyces radiatus]|uniref:uncharacterized protein n=1 Tax=Halteromyces radiatus TaxID=101107 RepID=UPI00221F07E5|nr:uncharacterized protein BX664DRAFT_386039 [Halteromyces radiatus]KAI8089572.1 hypothetical protein BX664DRAFT_386039 [Halteromyces radiatus]